MNDTWTYSHGIWTEIFPSTNPGNRSYGSMVYDAHDGYRVLFGGWWVNTWCGCQAAILKDTWKFAGGAWKALGWGPPGGYGGQLAYDAKTGYVLEFGGYGNLGATKAPYSKETWKLRAGA